MPISLSPGVPTNLEGWIDALAYVDYYAVDVQAGQWLCAEVGSPAGDATFAGYLRILDAAGTAVAIGEYTNLPVSAVAYHAAEAGRYYVGVSSYPNTQHDPLVAGSGSELALGVYRLRLILTDGGPESGPGHGTIETADPLEVIPDAHVTVFDAIGERDDVDLLAVELVAGQVLTAALRPGDESELQGFLRVFDTAGKEMTRSQLWGGTYRSQTPLVHFEAREDGTYYLGVSAWDNLNYSVAAEPTNSLHGLSLGSYALTVLVRGAPGRGSPDGNDTIPHAVAILLNPEGETTIRDTFDSIDDVDMFSVYLEARQRIVIDRDPALPEHRAPVYFRVFDSAGAEITAQEPHGESEPGPMQFTAETAGRYYIGVAPLPRSEVFYHPYVAGSGVAGITGDYAVTLTPMPPQPDLAGADFRILDPWAQWGEEVRVAYSIENSGDADAGSFDAWVILSRMEFGIDQTRLAEFRAPALAAGATISGTLVLRLPDAEDAAIAGWSASDELWLSLTVDPHSEVDELNEANNVRRRIGLDHSVLHVVTAEEGSNDTRATAQAVLPTSRIAGRIDLPGDVDFFTIEVAEPGRLSVDLGAAGGLWDGRMELYGPGGRLLMMSDDRDASSRDPRMVQHLLPGQYWIAVRAAVPGVGASEYALALDFLPAIAPFENYGPHDSAHLATGDFDGDGRLDLAVHTGTAPEIRILRGLGDGTFSEIARSVLRYGYLTDLAAADLNRDGLADVITVYNTNDQIGVLLARSDGGLAEERRFSVGWEPRSLAIGDFDWDGAVDLAVANSESGDISVLAGRGDGTFYPERRLAAASYPTGIVSADFNGDGHLDIATLEHDNPKEWREFRTTVIAANGDGTFGDPHVLAAPWGSERIAADDYNGDGRSDLLFSGYNESHLWLGRGDGTFQQTEAFSLSRYSVPIAAGDFDGDGPVEIAVPENGDDSGWISIYSTAADGSVSMGHRYRVGGDPIDIAAGDFDGDGHLDLAAASSLQGGISVLLGLGDGTFQGEEGEGVGRGPVAIAGGDFNGDGFVDLATLNHVFRNEYRHTDVSILLGLGNGTFRPEYRLASKPAFVAGPILVEDLNRDGRSDLVYAKQVPEQQSDHLQVRLGLGNGGFTEEKHYAVRGGPLGIVAADLNQDGYPDLAVTDAASGIWILLGAIDGTFSKQILLAQDRWLYAITVADLDGDGYLDVAATGIASDTVSVFFGDKDVTFARSATFDVGHRPMGILAIDLTGDDLLDLLVANSGLSENLVWAEEQGSLSLLVQTEPGAFREDRFGVRVYTPQTLVRGDLNGDGWQDVLVSGAGAWLGSTLVPGHSVLFGMYGTSWYEETDLGLLVQAGPTAPVLADFNRDGRLDVAYALEADDAVKVFLGVHEGSIEHPIEHPYASVPVPAFIDATDFSPRSNSAEPIVEDINGDATADVVLINQSGGILVRAGMPGRPGAYAPPVLVNSETPARSVDVVEVRGQRLLAAIDQTGRTADRDSVSLYTLDGECVGRFDTGRYSLRIAAADLNGDRLEDMVVANALSGDLSLFLGTRSGGFSSQPPVAVGVGVSDIELIDLDGSGSIDILAANEMTGQVTLLVNQGGATFDAQPYRAGSGTYGLAGTDGDWSVRSLAKTASLATADFNGDGLPDVVAANAGSNSVALLSGKASGTLVDPWMFPASAPPVVITTGDLNRDGRQDLAVLYAEGRGIGVLLGDAQGGFREAPAVDASSDPAGLTLAEVTGDANLDLLVSNAYGDLLILPGNGDGTFQPFLRAGRDVALAAVDVNGDGEKDWILANETRDRVIVEIAGKGQTFAQGREDGLLAPGAVLVEDLDADGHAEIVVANGGGNNVLVYRGLADGQFEPARAFATGTNPTAVTAKDLDGDGRLDLAVTNGGSNDVSVLLGDPEQFLKPGVRLSAGYGPADIEAGDFTGDGFADLVVSNVYSNDAYLLAGLGSGFFNDRTPTIFPTGAGPSKLLVGEFDPLPGLDLVSINRLSSTITHYSNFDLSLGKTFASGGLSPADALAGDLNGDAFTDLLVANAGSGGLALFLGGSSGLVLEGSYTSSELLAPAALALAGFGEMGEINLWVVNEGDEVVTPFSFAIREDSGASPPAMGFGLITLAASFARFVGAAILEVFALGGFLDVFATETPSDREGGEAASRSGISEAAGSGSQADRLLSDLLGYFVEIVSAGNDLVDALEESVAEFVERAREGRLSEWLQRWLEKLREALGPWFPQLEQDPSRRTDPQQAIPPAAADAAMMESEPADVRGSEPGDSEEGLSAEVIDAALGEEVLWTLDIAWEPCGPASSAWRPAAVDQVLRLEGFLAGLLPGAIHRWRWQDDRPENPGKGPCAAEPECGGEGVASSSGVEARTLLRASVQTRERALTVLVFVLAHVTFRARERVGKGTSQTADFAVFSGSQLGAGPIASQAVRRSGDRADARIGRRQRTRWHRPRAPPGKGTIGMIPQSRVMPDGAGLARSFAGPAWGRGVQR
ncbi:MAG: VCBS repeat-containing protein [Pirellulales bacterium]|nr:VCBS repeat-containing protein [Pirellulales bacterium]